MCKKVICFVRVSSQHQDLKPQKEAIERQIIADGYQRNEIAYVEGKESAIKLKEEQRQTLNEMKQLISEHETIESVYFFAVDRLARRMSVVMSVKEWADEHHINLVFLNPNYMSTFRKNEKGELVKNELTDLLLAMLSYGAAMEMQIKKARFEEAKKVLRSQNKVTGALPFGYESDEEGKISINKEQAKIINWVFDCYINKEMSTNQIYNEGLEFGYWNAVKGRSGGASKICQILKNKVYCGQTPKQNKYDTNYPIIISEEKIDKAIALMHERKYKSKVYQKNIYYAKGIIRDEESNTCLIADRNHVRYFTANANQIYAVSLNVIDSLIWRSAKDEKATKNNYDTQKEIDGAKETLSEIEIKIATFEKQLREIDKKSERNYSAYIDGRISNELYTEKDDSINAERKKVQKRKNEEEMKKAELLNVLENLEKKNKAISEKDIYNNLANLKDDNLRVEIIKETISNMTVKKLSDNNFLFKVYNRYGKLIDKYLYIANRSKSVVYWSSNQQENDDFKITLNVTNEIEKRFKREYR